MCKSCTGNECHELMPIASDCVNCHGKGCDSCDQTGRWELDKCPHQFLAGDNLAEVMDFAQAARDGTWPMAGGMMDQTQWFIDASKLIFREWNIAEAKAVSSG